MTEAIDFDTLFSAEYPRVLKTVTLICNDSQLAQDVAQVAFVELLRHWEKVRHHDRPGAWVRRVAIRRLMRVRRHDGRRRDAERGFEPAGPPEPADVDVLLALREVSPRQRAALVLHYFKTCRSTTSPTCSAARNPAPRYMCIVAGPGCALCSGR